MEWYQEQQVDPYVYDLEFIGDVQNINTCYIWEICVYHISSGQCFKQIIDPDPAKKTFPLPPIKEIPQLTRKFLDDNDAKHWSQVWPMFKMWINQTCQTFKPVFTAGYDPYDFHLLLFNRWGQIIFESYNADIGWDGTYNGKTSQDGTYTWAIDFKTNSSDERIAVIGHLNLIR